MAAPRAALTNAPITEAVVDFRVAPRDGLRVADFEPLVAMLAPDYTKKGPLIELHASVQVESGQAPQTDSTLAEVGVRLHSADDRYVLQLQLEGFSLSRLAPYENWETLRSEAMRLWHLYVKETRVETVRRIAARYINNLQLPIQPGEDLAIYLSRPPELPPGLSQSVTGFIQRVSFQDPESGVSAVLTQALTQFPIGQWPPTMPVILDIDVFRVRDVAASSADVWNQLETVRAFKNRIFYSALTDKAVENYL